MDALQQIKHSLDRYFDEEDPAGLDDACCLAAENAIDIGELLNWLAEHPAEDAPRDLATRRLRAVLRLPPMPGPVCRPMPPPRGGRSR